MNFSIDFSQHKANFLKLNKLIEKYNNIVIFRHEMPDPDCLASQHSMFEWIKLNFPKKNVSITGINIPKNLNVFFKPSNTKTETNFLAITMDTPTFTRIDNNELLKKADYIVKFDHHKSNENFENLAIFDSEASSTSELVSLYFLYNLKNKKINDYIANILYLGIITDSGRFLFPTTSNNTYLVVIALINNGLKKDFVHKNIYSKTFDEIKFNSFLISNLKQSKNKKLVYVILENEWNQFNIPYENAKNAVYLLAGIKDVSYWVYATKDVNANLYRISIRSAQKPINKFAENYGGGGHALACGIKVQTLKEVKEIIDALAEY